MADRPQPTWRARDAVARWPAVPAAALFILGIVLHATVPVRPAVWLLITGALLVAAFAARGRAAIASACIAVGVVLLGLTAAQLFRFQYPSDHVGLYAGDDPRLAQVELSIEQPPRVLTNPFDQRRAMAPKQVTTARVLRVLTRTGWADTSGEVLVQIVQPHPGLAVGQTVRATGMLQRPAPAMNPGQFDWARYYRDQRILTSFTVPNANNLRILDEPFPGVIPWARERVRRLLAAGFAPERALDHALLRALLLGDGDPALRDVKDQFERTGTSHHLAISGMHIAVLGGCVYGVCRLLRLAPRKAVFVATGFVLVYGLLALPSPPVVRSVLLCLAFGLGWVSGRTTVAVQLLAVSVLAMLLYRPLDAYNPGFQLSFGTVLGLMLFTRPMRECFESYRDRDQAVLESFTPPTLRQRAVRRANRALLEVLAAGVVAWGVSMPLIAYHFEMLNPWAIGAGIVLAPVVLLALVGGMLKVVLTGLWPGLAGAWAAVAAEPVGWMRGLVDWLAKFPVADIPVPPPPVWLIVLFYVMLLPALLPEVPSAAVWLLRVGRVVACAFMLALPLVRGVERIAPAGETRVTLLAVGAGQCAVVQPPGGRTVLVDAGSNSLSDLLAKCLGPFLRQARCTDVDTVVMSHADYDHVSAVEEVVRAYGVREVWAGPQMPRHAAAGSQTHQLLAALDRLERPPRVVRPGERTPLGRDTAVEVLWPPAGAGGPAAARSNDGSLVLKLTHAGRSILFPGDVQDAAMRELLRDPDRLRADVLVAPHHGSGEASTAAFVAAVDPLYIVSSNDRSLTNKQRDFERMIGDRPLYRTNRCGSITIVLTRDGEVRVEPFLAVEPTRAPPSTSREVADLRSGR